MNGPHWIVCEQTSRWASALRLALDRDAAARGGRYRVREVRSLAELTMELAQHPTSMVAVEVTRRGLGDALAWLAAARRQFPRARLVALLDRSLSSAGFVTPPPTEWGANDAGDALREAGALDVAVSPRQLGAAIELGRRHAAATSAADAIAAEELPITERVRAMLPWQDAPAAIR